MTTEESSRAVEQEERAAQIRIAAMKDERFMAEVREALAEVVSGGRGTPWPEVKKELGIT